MILYVAIRFEATTTTLMKSEREKTAKYESFAEAVKRWDGSASEVLVRGFPVGARGKWHYNNESILKHMQNM